MTNGIDQWWLQSAEDLIGSEIMRELQLLPGHVFKGMVLSRSSKYFHSFVRHKIQVVLVQYRTSWTSGLTAELRGTLFCLKGSKPTSIWKE